MPEPLSDSSNENSPTSSTGPSSPTPDNPPSNTPLDIGETHIEWGSGQQERGPLVPFGEPLSSSDPECECTGSGYGIVEVVDGLKCCFDTVEFVRFVEPLVVTPNSLVDLDGE